jgi:hypothetical protein
VHGKCHVCYAVVVKKAFQLRSVYLLRHLRRHPFTGHYYNKQYNASNYIKNHENLKGPDLTAAIFVISGFYFISMMPLIGYQRHGAMSTWIN